MDSHGIVYLVGAGPGDAGLLTRRGAELLATADCVVYDGLVADSVLALVPESAECIYAGKKRAQQGAPLRQDEINSLLVERAAGGQRVVRLKGGDPFVFGRGAEEALTLAAAGIEFEIVPGVSAATAVPAYAGIPLTMRGVTSTVTMVTGHEAPDKPGTDVDWNAVAQSGTVVLFMALSTLEVCAGKLIAAGRRASTPAAAIYWGTTSSQKTIASTLGEIADACADAQLKPPVLVIIGDVARRRDELSWFESKPLFGRRLLVTRTGAGAERVARSIRELGGEPLLMPVTTTEAIRSSTAVENAFSTLGDGGYRWLVFASANAVETFFDAAAERGLDARILAGSKIAAVGRKTADSLHTRGIRADLVPERGNAARLAKAVTDSASPGELVLLPCAEGARPELAGELRAGGLEVEPLPLYRTVPAKDDDVRVTSAVRRLLSGAVDGALFFAPSQVRAFAALFGDKARDLIGSMAVVGAIGETTAQSLADLGATNMVVAESPSGESLVDAVAAKLANNE